MLNNDVPLTLSEQQNISTNSLDKPADLPEKPESDELVDDKGKEADTKFKEIEDQLTEIQQKITKDSNILSNEENQQLLKKLNAILVNINNLSDSKVRCELLEKYNQILTQLAPPPVNNQKKALPRIKDPIQHFIENRFTIYRIGNDQENLLKNLIAGFLTWYEKKYPLSLKENLEQMTICIADLSAVGFVVMFRYKDSPNLPLFDSFQDYLSEEVKMPCKFSEPLSNLLTESVSHTFKNKSFTFSSDDFKKLDLRHIRHHKIEFTNAEGEKDSLTSKKTVC